MWCINCSLHKLRVSFVTYGLSPLKKFQRDSFVKCISSSANISTGILHQKCANKSHLPPMCATSHERTKGQNASFPTNCPGGNSSWLSCQKLLHLNSLSQRLLMDAQRYLPNIFMSLLPTNFKHIKEDFCEIGKSI